MIKKVVNIAVIAILVTAVSYGIASAAKSEKIKIGIKHDTYAEEGYPDTSPWNNRNFYVGYDLIYGKLRTRTFLNYNLNPLIEKNVAAEKIVSAKLKIYQYYAAGGSYSLELRQVEDGWNQYSLNWNKQPDTKEVSTHGLSSDEGWKSVDVTEIVKEQLRTGDDDKGVSLRTENESNAGGIFWSTACEAAPSGPICDGKQPFIEIEYLVNEPPAMVNLKSPEDGLHTNVGQQSLEWHASEDPNGDTVYYRVEISFLPDFSSIYLISDWQTELTFDHEFEEDSVYFWRIHAKDEWMGDAQAIISVGRRIEVDTTPPDVPKIEPMPPFTFGEINRVIWQFDESCEKYQVKFLLQRFENSVEDPENVIFVETEDLGYEFTNLAEQEYFYRVKSIDVLGNESDWSEVVSSFQDHSPPIIRSLKSSEKYISPLQSQGIQDFAEISFSVRDVALEEWALIIENSKREVVYELNGEDQDFSFMWPDPDFENLKAQNFPEGVYFIYLKVIDQVGLADHSNVIAVQIDNTAPIPPKISSPVSDSLLNSQTIKIRVNAEPFIANRVFINGKVSYEFSTGRFSKKSSKFQEGANNIIVKSIDQAGNSSESKLVFKTDWTPPQISNVNLEATKDSRSIDIVINGKDWSKAYIYNLAGIHKIIDKKQKRITLITNWTGNTKYSFYVVLEDAAGNQSPKSKMVSYKTPEDENPFEAELGKGAVSYLNSWDYPTNKLPSASCQFNYYIHENRAELVDCQLPSPILDEIDHYSYDRRVFFIEARGRFSDRVKIEAKAYNCKKFSWQDPDTWLKCKVVYVGKRSGYVDSNSSVFMYVNEHRQDQSNTRGFFRNRKYVTSIIKESHHKGAEVKMRSVLDFEFYMDKEKTVEANGNEFSPYSNMIEVPEVRYMDMDFENAQYFRFPFNEIVGVTQWYGNINSGKFHRGIDFGSYKKKVYSMNDGYVTFAGWDPHSSKCLSGGNLVIIKHDNGLYSLYAHLKDYEDGNGHKWQKGDRIRRGERVGVTGNSGFFGCQPIGYHLHLEVRKNSSWQSHVNPKKYIDIDWDKVPVY